MELLCFYKICNYICGACPSPCFSSLIYIMGYVSVMGYVSHIFMYMDIRNHINLIKNHGYEGKIGMIKKDVHGIVMLAAKAGDIVLYRPYKEDENDYEENTTSIVVSRLLYQKSRFKRTSVTDTG